MDRHEKTIHELNLDLNYICSVIYNFEKDWFPTGLKLFLWDRKPGMNRQWRALCTIGLKSNEDYIAVNGNVVVKEGTLPRMDEEKTTYEANKLAAEYINQP